MHPAQQFSHWLSTPFGAVFVVAIFVAMVMLAIRNLRPKSATAPPVSRPNRRGRHIDLHSVETFALEAVYLALVKTNDARRLLQIDLENDLTTIDRNGWARTFDLAGYAYFCGREVADRFDVKAHYTACAGGDRLLSGVLGVNNGLVTGFTATVNADGRICIIAPVQSVA